ncbi:MAG TPA: DUF2894 domain-containing protein [Burkholderiaceae bacterium]|nr:DUF2894 domain-containing protein [Burkholderiaceae bacterium]
MTDVLAPPSTTVASVLSELDALRALGADRWDPVRFHHLEVLARRLPEQTPAVQRVLAQRLAQRVAQVQAQLQRQAEAQVPVEVQVQADGERHAHSVRGKPAASPSVAPAAQGGPLAQLLRELQPSGQSTGIATAAQGLTKAAQAPAPLLAQDDGASLSELGSVRRFGEVWAKVSAQQQVDRALDRGPENAGPLNSHRLMLRALSLMRDLSPDYLRRFLSQVDTLLWLEQTPPDRRPVRRTRKGG